MMHRMRAGFGLAVLLAVLVAAGGCKSTKPVEDFPKTVEATVEAKGIPEKVDFIDVNPWSAKPGDQVTIRVGGTPGRTGSVKLTGDNGVTKTVDLKETEPGVYTGTLALDQSMKPGRYRVEGVLTGGPSGAPATLVSSRALVVEAPPPPPPPVDPCDAIRKSFATPGVFFAFNKDALNEDARRWIADAAQKLAAHGAIAKVVVEGHCDERGTNTYNLELGARRARAVLNLLKKQPGMNTLDISTISYGEERPVVPNAQTEEDHARNRRAVLVPECTPAR